MSTCHWLNDNSNTEKICLFLHENWLYFWRVCVWTPCIFDLNIDTPYSFSGIQNQQPVFGRSQKLIDRICLPYQQKVCQDPWIYVVWWSWLHGISLRWILDRLWLWSDPVRFSWPHGQRRRIHETLPYWGKLPSCSFDQFHFSLLVRYCHCQYPCIAWCLKQDNSHGSNWSDSNYIDIRNPFLPCRKLNSSSQVLHWSNRHLGNDCIDSLSWSKVSTMFERISSVWLEPPSSSFSCSSMYPNLKC